VAQPVVETETVMVEQDPPIDPSVERAEPTLPVSTRTTGMLTSTPQLGPATTTATTTTVATTEIVPVTQETTVTQVSQFCLCWIFLASLLGVVPMAQVLSIDPAVLFDSLISGSLVYCQVVATYVWQPAVRHAVLAYNAQAQTVKVYQQCQLYLLQSVNCLC